MVLSFNEGVKINGESKKEIVLMFEEERRNKVMTPGQERMLERIRTNDQYPERGEIKLAVVDYANYYFERQSAERHEIWYRNGQLKSLFDKSIGVKKEWDENGYLESVINYRNGVRNGLSEHYYPNGQVASRTTFKYGEEDGPCETWHPNGQLRSHMNYKNGKLNGLYERWHPNGQLSFRCNYYASKIDGLCEAWHPNGQLESRKHSHNEKLNGLFETWYDNGQYSQRVNYKNGVPDGLSESWTYDGQLYKRLNYKNGKLDGLWENWRRDGQLSWYGSYKNDVQDGPFEEWYDNGNQKRYENYKDGEKYGKQQYRYENGNLKSEEVIGDENDIIEYKMYSPKGQLLHKMSIFDGHRLEEQWNENGDLTKRLVCDHLWRPLYKNQVKGFMLDNKRITALEHYQPIEVKDGWLQLGMDGKARLFQSDPTNISDEVMELARALEPSLRHELNQLGVFPDTYIRIKRGSEVEEKPLSKGDSQSLSQEECRSKGLKL